jgi:hypothetical protein
VKGNDGNHVKRIRSHLNFQLEFAEMCSSTVDQISVLPAWQPKAEPWPSTLENLCPSQAVISNEKEEKSIEQ